MRDTLMKQINNPRQLYDLPSQLINDEHFQLQLGKYVHDCFLKKKQ